MRSAAWARSRRRCGAEAEGARRRDPHRQGRYEDPFERSTRLRRRARRRHRDRRALRGLERPPARAARSAWRGAGRVARGLRQLPIGIGDLPHERGARRAAGFFGASRPRSAAAPPLGHHPRAVARVHGPRLRERARARLVARADRRDADPEHASTTRSRRAASMSRAFSASISAMRFRPEGPGMRSASAPPTRSSTT